jgi:formylmethanofuran dehydrogenase subunit D
MAEKSFSLKFELTLLTGRTTEQAISSLKGKNLEEYKKVAAVVYLSEKDMEKMALKDGENVKLETDAGFVVVKAKKSEEVSEGLAVIPPGPWLNMLVQPKLGEAGIPITRNIKVIIEKTSENITTPSFT